MSISKLDLFPIELFDWLYSYQFKKVFIHSSDANRFIQKEQEASYFVW